MSFYATTLERFLNISSSLSSGLPTRWCMINIPFDIGKSSQKAITDSETNEGKVPITYLKCIY